MGDAPPVQIPLREALPADIPTGAARLIKRLGVGWTFKALYARGPMQVVRVDKNLRREVAEWVIVDSLSVRASHTDGRAAVAIWIRKPGGSYGFELGWRGRWLDEVAPARIDSDQLKLYIEAADFTAYGIAVLELTEKRKVIAAKAAATRAAKKQAGTTVELGRAA